VSGKLDAHSLKAIDYDLDFKFSQLENPVLANAFVIKNILLLEKR
jgi:hypothetical protein